MQERKEQKRAAQLKREPSVGRRPLFPSHPREAPRTAGLSGERPRGIYRSSYKLPVIGDLIHQDRREAERLFREVVAPN